MGMVWCCSGHSHHSAPTCSRRAYSRTPQPAGSAQSAAAKPRGLLGSFMSSLAMRVVGKTSLSAEDIAPALADMKRKLMERNVAEGIAQNVCDSVGRWGWGRIGTAELAVGWGLGLGLGAGVARPSAGVPGATQA